jgi:putative heme-binding domain-containing protein
VPYLVESVLFPSQQLSPVFKGTLVVTKDGDTLSGLVVGETAESVELLLLDATRRTINKSTIADRQTSKTSPMPQGLVKTPEELRDVLAYLLGQ